MTLQSRNFTASGADGFRYGFNGKEGDDEVSGSGNHYDYGFRIYNPRLGRFLSLDPLTGSFPWYTPYQFAGNKPIIAIDLDGLEELVVVEYWKAGNLLGMVFVQLKQMDYEASLECTAEIMNLRKQIQTLETSVMYDKLNKKEVKAKNEEIAKLRTEIAKINTSCKEQKAIIEKNFNKVLVEKIEITSDSEYSAFSTHQDKRDEIRQNPLVYSEGKELSDELDLKLQNVLSIGSPAADKLNKTTYTDAFKKGSGYLGINVPQSITTHFDPNSSVIKPSEYSGLDKIALAMVLLPDLKVTLIGHTDSDGDPESNITLSNNRAIAAKEYLVATGISADRITTAGAGESQPTATNDTDEGKAANRRIEVKTQF